MTIMACLNPSGRNCKRQRQLSSTAMGQQEGGQRIVSPTLVSIEHVYFCRAKHSDLLRSVLCDFPLDS